ncbi:hypothetical protein B0H17DRAFT_1173559 [Mycena rosella]|uniref:Retrovirus-related Pol polyprotein from transposon TNT 1-94-like beta-barrel domain-containing protein n=1 Tax=Mycena rosella TaxID=1033263 RepID=A0AAD7H2T3_MYCRO|nr:hypothetical protein B0H17DRAFT_1173559 [Mycena rosella]
MPLEAIKAKTISGLELLDFDKRNYVRWAESALDAFLYAGIREYVEGAVTKPPPGDSDLPIWTKNNNLAQAGIRMKINPAERDYPRDHCTTASAHDIWTELKKCHRQKASTQTSLLDDLLGIRIERGADMVDAAGKVRDISKQVFEVGTLDADKLALAVLLRSLSLELRAICEKYEDDDLATPGDVFKSLEKEKLRWEEENKQKAAEEKANAARVQKNTPAKSATRGLCGTCNEKHRTDECWGEGGAIEGKRDEVLERRAARRKDAKQPASTSNANTSANTNAKPSAKSRFAMKDSSSKTVYFTMVEDDTETAAVATTDPMADVTPNAELEELYATYHAGGDSDSDASDYSMLAEVEHFTLIADSHDPFAGDTRATIHLSPVKADFFTFVLITPLKIWGVGGTYIEATARGDVHILQRTGKIFILKDVLYAPQAAMRLMSVGRIADTGHSAMFTSSGFSITDPVSNEVVAMGTHRNGKLYSLDGTILSPSSNASIAHIAGALPELRRWENERRTESGEDVGIYRTDLGELKSEEMTKWIAETGTKQQTIAPYTSAHIATQFGPQNDGSVEISA